MAAVAAVAAAALGGCSGTVASSRSSTPGAHGSPSTTTTARPNDNSGSATGSGSGSDAAVVACTPAQMRASTTVAQPVGYAWASVILVNTGPRPCQLEGYPSVTSTAGGASQVLASGSNRVMSAVQPTRVVLAAPGAGTSQAQTEAAFDLSAGPIGQGTTCSAQSTELDITLPGSGSPITVAAPFPTCTGEVFTAIYPETAAASRVPKGA